MGKTQKRAAQRARQDEAKGVKPVVKKEPEKKVVVERTALSSVVERVTLALQQKRFTDALEEMRMLRARGQLPRLGTLQRWVRDVDDCLISKDDVGTRVLHGILYLATQDSVLLPSLNVPVRITSESPLSLPREDKAAGGAETKTKNEADFKALSRVVFHEAGEDRQPPNKHDLQIYAPADACFPAPSAPPVPIKHHVAGVAGTCVVESMFSPEEVQAFISLGETLGYQADEPIRGDSTIARENNNVLGRACVWMAPEAMLARMWERIKPFVPETFTVGAGLRGVAGTTVQVKGINPRFRSYRYDEGFVYRPHIDGAWPRSGYGPGGQYKYDVDGNETSRLTLIVYLNDDFEGGETKFFLPRTSGGKASDDSAGAEVIVQGVCPKAGACLLFPHGDSRAPLHEGAKVHKGCKYILRTEVLYTRPAATGRQVAPEPKPEPEESKDNAKVKDNKGIKRNKHEQDLTQMKKRRRKG